VNGVKKWITQGYSADYFTTAVRTGGPGLSGISLLLIEKGEGVDTKKLKPAIQALQEPAILLLKTPKYPFKI